MYCVCKHSYILHEANERLNQTFLRFYVALLLLPIAAQPAWPDPFPFVRPVLWRHPALGEVSTVDP